MKSTLKKSIKILLAAAVGLALLDLFCTWYYNPVGYLRDESRATDVIRVPGAFTSRANEGFSWTVIDGNGYNNRELPGAEGVSVLMMGSSHVEGLYVLPGQDVSAQLGELLKQSGMNGAVYNIGTSNHGLARNVFNLDRALDRFQPSGYVTIETRDVRIFYNDVMGVLNGTMGRLKATEAPLGEWLSGRPLLRTVVRQLMVLAGVEQADDEQQVGYNITQELLDFYREELTKFFQLAGEIADEHGVSLIVYYHPTLLLQPDGSAVPDTDPRILKVFADACAAGGVHFLDLTDRFLDAYEAEHILPHGFINTAPGTGHLNADGNRMAAEALCEEILREEAEK